MVLKPYTRALTSKSKNLIEMEMDTEAVMGVELEMTKGMA